MVNGHLAVGLSNHYPQSRTVESRLEWWCLNDVRECMWLSETMVGARARVHTKEWRKERKIRGLGREKTQGNGLVKNADTVIGVVEGVWDRCDRRSVTIHPCWSELRPMSDELESQNDIISIRANHSYLSSLINWTNGKSALLDQGSIPFCGAKSFSCSFVYILSRMISGVYLNVRKRSRMFKKNILKYSGNSRRNLRKIRPCRECSKCSRMEEPRDIRECSDDRW